LISKKNKNKKSLKNIEKTIDTLTKEKVQIVNDLILLKSSFSIIDDMFTKEMENAYNKNHFIYKYFFRNNTDQETDYETNPKKINTFVENVMDPYGTQDRYVRELKELYEKEKEASDKNKFNVEQEQSLKKVWNEVKKTKNILKTNTDLIENLYYKIKKEKENKKENTKNNNTFYNTLNKFPNIVKLFGDNMETAISHISLKIDDIKENYNQNDNDLLCDTEEKISKRSDSSNSLMDFDVICESEKIL
jgi:hypothetical protein